MVARVQMENEYAKNLKMHSTKAIVVGVMTENLRKRRRVDASDIHEIAKVSEAFLLQMPKESIHSMLCLPPIPYEVQGQRVEAIDSHTETLRITHATTRNWSALLGGEGLIGKELLTMLRTPITLTTENALFCEQWLVENADLGSDSTLLEIANGSINYETKRIQILPTTKPVQLSAMDLFFDFFIQTDDTVVMQFPAGWYPNNDKIRVIISDVFDLVCLFVFRTIAFQEAFDRFYATFQAHPCKNCGTLGHLAHCCPRGMSLTNFRNANLEAHNITVTENHFNVDLNCVACELFRGFRVALCFYSGTALGVLND